jgi:hypothetical protein
MPPTRCVLTRSLRDDTGLLLPRAMVRRRCWCCVVGVAACSASAAPSWLPARSSMTTSALDMSVPTAVPCIASMSNAVHLYKTPAVQDTCSRRPARHSTEAIAHAGHREHARRAHDPAERRRSGAARRPPRCARLGHQREAGRVEGRHPDRGAQAAGLCDSRYDCRYEPPRGRAARRAQCERCGGPGRTPCCHAAISMHVVPAARAAWLCCL